MGGSRRQGRGARSHGARGRGGRDGRCVHADGRAPANGKPVPEMCELSPFSVFCALHLGITECESFEIQGRRSVAKRFGLADEQLDDYLATHGLSEAELVEAGFDPESARLDIEVAPAGISRIELARTLFEELRAAGGAASSDYS